MVLREPNDPLNQSRGIMGPLENATGVQNNRGRLRQRFDLIRKLGQGTYGKVQLGIDKETGQEVAIKTIKKSKIETEADLIRIRREIQIMSSVRHPNIIHIYEVFENREKMVLVMEYAAGGELYDYLNERKVLQDDEARRIFRQIASAAYYCHKHKICHRDLKLENILLDEKFNAKIADFGLSNVFDEVNLLKTFCGSPLYASPEIVRGTPYKGPEVDCWSLGVLLYTLVYGAMPFDGSNFKRLVKQISHGDYFEPKKPAEASPLIRIMLTVDPKKRADIRKVCAHPWVNLGFDRDCLAIADELATQTPVRLDLLLALANCHAINHNQVVIEQQPNAAGATNNLDQGAAGEVPGPSGKDAGMANHMDEKETTKEQPKKPKRAKVQSKSKSSPMLELIHDVPVEEELELPPPGGRERDEEDACDTLSEISEIQTLAEEVEGGAMTKAATAADVAPRSKVVKRERSKVRGEPAHKPTPSSIPATPSSSTPATQSTTEKPKKTEFVAEPKANTETVVPAKKTSVDPPSSTPTPTDEKQPAMKKKVVKPKAPVEPEKAREVEEPPATSKPAPAALVGAEKPPPKDVAPSASPSPAREVIAPAQKEKSATPPDKRDSTPASDSGEEGKSKAAKLKDRADSVSPTRIERRNSKVISQKTAELIQNLETKVSPSGSTTMEPPPKPPGIKKIVIPSFKVSDAKSKFESKPPRPLTTSVSRSKAAFEAKLQSQSSVEEKTPPKQIGKSDSPPVEPAHKSKVETPAQSSTQSLEKSVAATPPPVPKEEPRKVGEALPTAATTPKQTEVAMLEKAVPEESAKVESSAPAVANKVVTHKGAGKIQIPAALTNANDKAAPASSATTNEIKPVLMDTGKGGTKPAVMVVKGKISPMPDARTISTSPASTTTLTAPVQAQAPLPTQSPPSKLKPTQTPTPTEPQTNATTNTPDTNTITTTITKTTTSTDLSASTACNESFVAPPLESDTEGETGKTAGTPPLGPAAAAKQKLLSKLPAATQQPSTVAVPNTSNVQSSVANGGPPNKEQAVKKISSVITKIVSSGSVDKGLNTEDGPKKFSTLPRASKPESEKIIKTEVSFPVSAATVPLTPTPAPIVQHQQQPSAPSQEKPAFQTQQSQQERIIPIKLVDEVVGSPPATPSTSTTTAAMSASPSMVSVSNASRASVPLQHGGSSRRMDSSASILSRQNSSETESYSMAPPQKHEPLRKCPREFLIPIKLEGSGQTVTPKEELASGGSTADATQAGGGEDDFRVDSRLRSGRFARPKRYSSLLSDSSFDDEPSVSVAAGSGVRRSSAATTGGVAPASGGTTTSTHTRSRSQGDEPTTPGGTFKRYRYDDERNRRHATAAPDMPLDRSDSFSSAEEDEEDAFQVLTAESLFSNLLDRVRNLTRRINRDDPLMAPNWSTDPATFGLWGASPLREFMSSSRAPSETRSFGSSGPGSGAYRRESNVAVGSAGGPGGAWRRSLSRDLSGDSDSGHSASMNTANAQSRSQLSRLSSDLYETGSARSLPLSTRRSPSYLSHRSVENDPGSTSYGSTRSYTRTLSHSGASDYGSGSGMPVSRTLPLRRSLKTFDRSPQNILPEYDTAGPGGGGSMHHHHMSPSGSLRHSLFDSSKYDNPGSYLTRIRSASRERGERESSMASSSANRVARTLYPSSGTLSTTGEANGWEGGLDAVLSPSSSLAASIYSTTSGTTVGGVGSSISPISTTVSLNSESLLSPNSSSFSLDNGDSPGSSSSRLLSVQEKMNNYSQYYQSLTQSPFRRLPLASPSQIHANSNSNLATFGVGLSELRNAQPPTTLSRPVSFQPHPVVVPLMVDAPPMEVGLGTSTSDSGSATPCIQSPVSNPMSSSVTSPSISPPQVPSPVTVPYKSPQEISPQRSDDAKAAKPPSSSIPRWPTVSVRQHRPLSISSFPDGPRASSVSRVMSPPPHPQSGGQHGTSVMTKGPVEVGSPSVGIGILKRRDNSRATSVERITRLLERKSMPREMLANGDAAGDSAATTGSGKSKNAEEVNQIGNESTSVIGVVESEKANQSMKKPKFLQSLEKKWEKFTNKGSQNDDSGRSTMNNSVDMSCNNVTGTDQIDANGTSSAASPEPNQAGATSEESSSHEDNKFNESVLLRRALSPEKKVKPNSRLAAAGGTVGFMLGKFKKMEESPAAVSVTPAASSAVSRIPTGRPPLGINGVGGIGSRLGLLGRRTQMPYTGTTSDSVLTLTAKEMGRAADNSSGDESSGLLRSAAQIAQEKRRLHPKLEVKKEMPSCTIEGPVSPPVVLATQQQATSPPQIQIQDSTEPKVNYEVMPKMDLASLSPISVSEGERTESDESNAGTASPNSQMKSDSTSAVDDAESVSDRILRKSFYNRFNASGIDRNRRSHSVTPGSSRRIMPNSATATLRVNSNGGGSNGGVSSAKGSGNHQPVRRSVSPSASTVASAESKDSSDHSSTQNRSPSPYWSGLNKYNPNPLFKELMVGEDLGKSNTDVGKKTEYSRRITSKLSKLLREIESDLNSCQLTKTESGVSDDGDGALLLGGVTGHHHNSTLIPNRVMAPQITTAVATSSGVSTLKKKNNYNEN